jgi:peptide/nickel transport system permease protein
VESIFSWPGIGQATYLSAMKGPDLPMLQGLFLVISAAVIVANLAADLLYGKLDPRVVGR